VNQRSTRRGWGWAAAVLLLLAVLQGSAQTNTIQFRAVDLFVDSTNQPLAAYQVEFTASPGVKIVGIEGGDHEVFRQPPFYDPKAIQRERAVLGAFSTAAADKLPKGKTRVATIHVQTSGSEALRFELVVKAAATVGGRKIPVQATATTRRLNEDQPKTRRQ
jgi:hypothetical protein